MGQNTASAISAALAVARDHGVHCDEPVVLRDAWHILLHLQPAPVVARVSTGLPFPEGPDPQDLVRELVVASHAARAGAAVVPPSDALEPGPHLRDGHIVTFWRYVEPHAPADPASAGAALRVVHEVLSDLDADLPPMDRGGDMDAMLALLPTPEAEVLANAVSTAPAVDGQALHGDAHLGNCLGSPSGPLWHDLETACRGPREYDLAALVMRDRIHGDNPRSRTALAAYGEHDAELLVALLPLYTAWVTASMLVALPRRPELRPLVDERFAWLSRRQTTAGSSS